MMAPVAKPDHAKRFALGGHRSVTHERITAAIDACLTLQDAADLWGVSVAYLSRTVRYLGRRWPDMRGLRTTRWVWVDGQYMSVAAACRLRGCQRHRVYRRYVEGIRGPALFAPAIKNTQAPQHYELDLNASDWKVIVATADEIGDDAARQRFGVPIGAIRAARRGEVERLG